MRKERGFTLPEVIVSLVVLMIIIGSVIPLFQKIYEFYQDLSMKEQLKQAKKNIEDFYRANIFMINSTTLESRSGYNISIPLGNGKYFYTNLDYIPLYQSNGDPSGLLAFMANPYDGGMSNIRVYITPLVKDSSNQFSYRDIYLIWRKNSRASVQSNIRRDFNGRYVVDCDPQEYCVKIDGYLITSEVWKKTTDQVVNIANRFTKYAEEKYAADPTKNALMYYLANTDTNGKNSKDCANGGGQSYCYFSEQSEIKNTCLVGGRNGTLTVRTIDGDYSASVYNYGLSSNSCFTDVGNPNLYGGTPLVASFESINPAGAPILYDNGGSSVRNPENLGTGNLSGYNAILFTCISDNSCIVYRISQ
jgi:prepilin-type N-terminal cleavage/methylation domain-containing protein